MSNNTERRTVIKEKISDILILKEILSKPNARTRIKRDYREISLFSIIWRVLLICLIIDGGIFFYFHFVKKVTVSEGIRQLREAVFDNATHYNPRNEPAPLPAQPATQPVTDHKKLSRLPVAPAEIPDRSTSRSIPLTSSSPTSYENRPERDGDLCSTYKVCDVKQTSIKGKVFSWKDKDGLHHFSNTSFPLDNDTLKVEAEINSNSFYSVTKFIVRSNQILVPVTLSHKGKSVSTHMVLDTGCTHTTAPFHLLDKLNVTYNGDVTSTLANGSKTEGKRTTIDTLVVGPRRASNLPITGSRISGSMNMGLLGMNFLKENPFQIDFEKQMIVWM